MMRLIALKAKGGLEGGREERDEKEQDPGAWIPH
jgi:hypothetical protein